MNLPPPRLPFWERHMASVPKGFLRYYMLKLLADKPLSGSEIMEIIEEETEGRWKPSPGSVYPLLSLLQDHGYIVEMPKDKSGKKRYQITKDGKKFLREQEKIRRGGRKTAPLFLGPFLFNHCGPDIDSEKRAEIRRSLGRLMKSIFHLRNTLFENPTEKTLEEVKDLLVGIAEKIEETTKRLG